MEGNKDKLWGVIVVLILVALIVFAAIALVSGKSLEGASLIIGALSVKLGTLIDYRYGSSQGSKDKTELMASERVDIPLPSRGIGTGSSRGEV